MSSMPPDQDHKVTPSGGIHPTSRMQANPRPASSAGVSGNALPVGTYLAEFELTGVVGEGGFGIVYQAWDHSLQRRVALKEYMPAALAAREQTQVQVRSERHRDTFQAGLNSFINEARLLAQFDHPSLLKVYRFWEANGTAYMVMPLYEGITLKDHLKQAASPPDEGWLLAMLASLTDALAVLHAEHCYHRDIAPDNIILLAGSGRPLLLDFGAARRVIGDMTQALTVILKPGYAPIEQYAEVPDMKQGPWTDLYALAASVHLAIVGKVPPASISRIVSDQFVPLTQAAAGRYSTRFLQALDKALKVRPEDRPQSVAELRADLGLEPTQSEHTTQIRPRSGSVAPARPSTTFGLGVAALVLALSSVGGYLALSASKSKTSVAAAPAAVVHSPAPVPAGVAASSAVQRFDVREEFDKVMAGQSADFGVKAAAVKPQLRIGRDRLVFSVSAARDGYAQVLLLGPDGSLMLLFPNAQSSDNRIKAGQTLQLPQANWPLDTSEPAGPEHFLVIVSAEPRDYSELSKQREYIFLQLPTQQRGAALASSWTRSTPLLLGGIRNCATVDCDAYGAVRFSVEVVH
ncbi:MAG: serine/threonine protein kinase [Leptothrix sp. (in: b-proteobacteria)]